MTRRQKAAGGKKKKSGVLVGMRQGVKSMAGTGSRKAAKPAGTRNVIMNIITALAVLLAGGLILQRCGVITF